MACTIINGNEIDCIEVAGGVPEIYIAAFTDVAGITASSGTITAMNCYTGKKFWTFQLEKENAQFTVTPQRSVENGTLFYDMTLTFTIKKMTAARRNALHILLQQRLMAIVKDNASTAQYQLMGQVNGADVTGAEGTTGKAFGDMNGYTVTLTAKETSAPNFVTASLISTLTSPA